MKDVEKYLEDNKDAFEQDLCQLLRIPSVSAASRHAADVRQAAEWVADQFRQMPLDTQLIETPGQPIVFAEWTAAADAPTALVYGHYDVQPPDPLDQWISPPFEPTIRDGNLYARGATDDKGQMLTHVKSVQAWMKTVGKLPVNVKFLVEGEEEVGSANLDAVVQSHRELLQCDCVVISDTSQFGPGKPAITYGLRGIAYFELRLNGPRQDLHSGSFGGAVTNPANALAQMLAALIDEEGRVQVPQFYDDVVPLAHEEREQFQFLPFNESKFMAKLGVEGVSGEAGFSTTERRWARPTFDVNGLGSGYQGEGEKTIIPSTAMAKFSFRLVPDQDPQAIEQNLRTMLQSLCPPGIEMQLIATHGAPGIVVPQNSDYVKAAGRAIEKGFGVAPVFIREGGSIPVVNTFKSILGVDTLLLGWGLDDDNTHSPNEKFHVADFHRGIKASAHLWRELAQIQPSSE